MYSYSNSSSSQGSMGLASSGSYGGGGEGLVRYGSAPSSLLDAAVDSVVGVTREFSGHSHLSDAGRSQTESVSHPCGEEPPPPSRASTTIGLQRAYGFDAAGGSSPSLVRHSSSPAGFLNQIAAAAAAAGDSGGFSVTRGIENYNNNNNNSENLSRLNSQLSFTRQESNLSYISEENESSVGDEMRAQNGQRKTTHSYGFGMGTSTWDESNLVMFSMAPNKRAKIDLLGGLDSMDNQFQFSMGQGGVEITQIEKLMHNIPQDSVPCKIRAKRGCATHPRSIAERERRTRISGKLKKLQVLVPNMDKQTSYADMLDLAVQHIKSLQNQVQKLHQELGNCTCGCKTKDL